MLDGLAAGLEPVVEQALSNAYGPTWVSTVEDAKGPNAGISDPNDPQQHPGQSLTDTPAQY